MTYAIQPVKIFGAGLAALISIWLTRDSQGIALGKYLLAQGESQNFNLPVKLSLFYSNEKIEEIAMNPKWGYVKGHLWDLAHKVLAVTAFYLTSSYSLIPESLKTAAWARVFFGSNFLICLAPVVLKLAHFCLDLKSIKERGQKGSTEFWKETAYQLGKCAEVLYFGRLGIVAALSFLDMAVEDKIAESFGYQVVALSGLFAAGYSFFGSFPPSQLNELDHSSQAIEKGNWTPETLKETAKDLESKLREEERYRVLSVICTQLEGKLEKTIYPGWTENSFVWGQEQELGVRKIHGREGVCEEIVSPRRRSEIQQIRFDMMLLCLNLRRLYRDYPKYDSSTMQKIQNFLYLQVAFYCGLSEQIRDLEDDILLVYCNWKMRPPSYNYEQIKEAVAKDPFFHPLRDMLPHMRAIGLENFTPELQDLFLVLENLLSNGNHPLSSETFKTDKTLYSKVKDAPTKTLDEIIRICQRT